MDYNYVENLIREDIKNKCPQLTNEIIEEYLDLTFWGANWVTYGDNKDLYILGIAEGKYDFYYVGCDNDYNIQLISCALSIKKNKDRDRDYIPPFESDFKEWSKKAIELRNNYDDSQIEDFKIELHNLSNKYFTESK